MKKKTLHRKIISTADGSHTLFIPDLNENYHSNHGAIQESNHVFIQMGLNHFLSKTNIHVFEVGFGTGLNALLALQIAEQHTVKIEFETVEKYPLVKEEYELLNYSNMLDAAYQEMFQQMHTCDWNVEETLTKYFSLKKTAGDVEDIVLAKKFDVVFFDAFAPDIQPNLWTVAVFRKMFDALNMGGVLVTYSAKGQVRRNMQEVGFRVERLAGPPGKREMLRAHKV